MVIKDKRNEKSKSVISHYKYASTFIQPKLAPLLAYSVT